MGKNRSIHEQYITECDNMIKALEAGEEPNKARELIELIMSIFGNLNATYEISGYYYCEPIIDCATCKKELEILRGQLHLIKDKQKKTKQFSICNAWIMLTKISEPLKQFESHVLRQ